MNEYLLKKTTGIVVLEKIYKSIFPNKCLFCQRALDDPSKICCENCETSTGYAHNLGDNIHVAYDYAEGVRHAIFRFKYEGKRMLARPMAEAIFKCFGAIETDLLLCVPSHESRVKERGYNQAALLATELSLLMGLSAYDGMIRVKDTAKQFALNPEERVVNVADAFALKENFCVEGKDVLLVDDIFTTGATVEECAKVLTDAHAKSVRIIAFARANLKGSGL